MKLETRKNKRNFKNPKKRKKQNLEADLRIFFVLRLLPRGMNFAVIAEPGIRGQKANPITLLMHTNTAQLTAAKTNTGRDREEQGE